MGLMCEEGEAHAVPHSMGSADAASWFRLLFGHGRATAVPVLMGAVLVLLAGCAETQLAAHMIGVSRGDAPQGGYKVGRPYKVGDVWYYPEENYSYDETGIASWYGPGFHARLTANGEMFDQDSLTAAHPTLQLPSLVRVTNLENGRSIVLRVNDRGPFANGRLIDVSRRAAELLGFRKQGTARVRVRILPEESRQVAEAARRGGQAPAGRDEPVVAAVPRGEVTTVALAPPAASPGSTSPVPAAAVVTPPPAAAEPSTVELPDGDIAPRPVVTQAPVAPTSIFVQAGAFSVPRNAQRLSKRLSSVARTEITPAVVDGIEFYRVRLGPLASVDEADRVLASVIGRGQTGARIIID